MELRRLRLLYELSRLGTVASVAEALAYSPSSVSVQLAELEREAGTKLLRRVGRRVELTAAGHRLAEHAEQALGADEAVRAELAGLRDGPRGRLRMTFVQTPALALLPGVFAHLATTAPQLQVEVVHRETPPALEDLRSRTVDLVVGVEYETVPVGRYRDVDRQDLLREDVLLALPHHHPGLPDRGPIRLQTCEHDVWGAGHRGAGLDALTRNVCNRVGGFEPDVRHRSDDALILSALVASGRAVTFLPALLATALPQITARHLQEERIQRFIFSAARVTATKAPAVRAVRAALQDAARQIAASRSDLEAVSHL